MPVLKSWRRSERASLARLKTAVREIEDRLAAHPSTGPWSTLCEQFLKSAQVAVEDCDPASGWPALKAAHRELLALDDKPGLLVEADRLAREAQAKLSSWRAGAVTALIGHRGDGSTTDPLSGLTEDEIRRRVRDARWILDEHADNVYRKLGLLERSLGGFALALLVALVVVAVVVGQGWPGPDAAGTVLASWQRVLTVYSLGALGALVSGATAVAGIDRQNRFPDLRGQVAALALRPVIGAAGALLAVVVVGSSLGGVTFEASATYAIALAAGFSERLASRATSRAIDSLQA